MKDYITKVTIARALHISTTTITRWVRFWENPNYYKPPDLVLPDAILTPGSNYRWYRKSDIVVFRVFKNKIETSHRGVLADFNRDKVWKKEGVDITMEKILSSDQTVTIVISATDNQCTVTSSIPAYTRKLTRLVENNVAEYSEMSIKNVDVGVTEFRMPSKFIKINRPKSMGAEQKQQTSVSANE